MSRLSPVSWNELIRKMHALGFKGPYTGKGPHPLMWRGDIRVMIPNPHRSDVSVDLIKKIQGKARSAGMTGYLLRRFPAERTIKDFVIC